MTIYRKVKVADRLPEINKTVFIGDDQGEWISYGSINGWSEWTNDWDHEECEIYPDWWLEEIELPTEEDIDRPISAGKDTRMWWHDKGWIQGANYILNKIKG